MAEEKDPNSRQEPPRIRIPSADSKPPASAGNPPDSAPAVSEEAASEAPTVRKMPPDESKRRTSRIPLDAVLTTRIGKAMGSLGEDAASRTIRLARPAGASAPETPSAPPAMQTPAAGDAAGPKTIRLQRPGVSGADAAGSAAKSNTSRIPLEAVLSPDRGEAGDASSGVKTIRLKKPGEAGLPRVATAAAADEAKSRTARLDMPKTSADSDSAPMTRRKTIRIKRADGIQGAKPARTLSPAGGKTAAAPSAGTAAPETADDSAPPVPPVKPAGTEPGWGFVLAAVAAVAIAAVLVYVLATQAFPDADLTWPGQIRI